MDGALSASASLHAEVEEVWPRDGEILIRGIAVGTDSSYEGVLIIRDRGAPETELKVPVSGDGSRFEVCIPLGPLAAARTSSEQNLDQRNWDLYLALPGQEEPLRLGRHLDDVTGKKKIFTYPAQTAEGVWVEPYYTVKDNLSITCHREGA